MNLKLIVMALMAAGLCQSQDGDSAFRPAFEVISIKPDDGKLPPRVGRLAGGGLSGRGITAKFLIGRAYDVQGFQIIDGPSWIGREGWVIEARPGENQKAPILNLYLTPRQKDDDEFKMRIQSLLADRFQLKTHKETREEQVYTLVVAKNGPKFQESKFNAGDVEKGRLPRLTTHPSELIGFSVSLDVFVGELSRQLDRKVIDRTGLNGQYDFSLRWVPDDTDPNSVPDGPSIFTALQEQLGLRLEAGKASVDAIVVDHIERPSAN